MEKYVKFNWNMCELPFGLFLVIEIKKKQWYASVNIPIKKLEIINDSWKKYYVLNVKYTPR